MKISDLAQLEKLREMRVERAAAALAALRSDMNRADEELLAAEALKLERIAETIALRRSFAANREVSLLHIENARDMVVASIENVEMAEEALDTCHTKILDISDQITEARNQWDQRQRDLDRWVNMKEIIKDEADMWVERREDAEDINKQQNMLVKNK